jgi:hypothetical protein
MQRSGIIPLMFDYFGQGNAPGKLEETNLNTIESDINRVVAVARGEGGYAMIGSRIAYCFPLPTDACHYYFIDPVKDARKYLRSMLKIERTREVMKMKRTDIPSNLFECDQEVFEMCEIALSRKFYTGLVSHTRFTPPERTTIIALGEPARRHPEYEGMARTVIDLTDRNPHARNTWLSPGLSEQITQELGEHLIARMRGGWG